MRIFYKKEIVSYAGIPEMILAFLTRMESNNFVCRNEDVGAFD